MIDNAALQDILLTATDISTVCEVYSSDAVPTDDGFDPADAIDCFAAVSDITFATRTYKRLVKSFGKVSRSIDEQVNSTSVTFSNLTREIAQFEFTNGFEGLILVVRLISRSQSIALTDSLVMFAGRCDKPSSGTRDALTVSAKFVLSNTTVVIPRRKFSKDDAKGRDPQDPLFEGFPYTPLSGSTVYNVREKRGGLLGFLGFHKTVHKTLMYSSVDDLDRNASVPVVFGWAQIMGRHLEYVDVGVELHIRTAFCDGPIEDIVNARSLDTRMPLSATSYAEQYGDIGQVDGDPSWPAPGGYSRTALIRCQANNSAVDAIDPAPDIVAVIKGMKLLTPDGSGVWNTVAWTDNPAAVVRYLLCGNVNGQGDYYNLDFAWIDDDSFNEVYDYNAELILDPSSTDYMFLT